MKGVAVDKASCYSMWKRTAEERPQNPGIFNWGYKTEQGDDLLGGLQTCTLAVPGHSSDGSRALAPEAAGL